MLSKRVCPLTECGAKFETDNPRKEFCSPEHSKIGRVRRWRAKHRKKGGGGGGGGNGGGNAPTLFDTITPEDSRAIYVPDTCYRTPEQEPTRKPAKGVSQPSKKAAA